MAKKICFIAQFPPPIHGLSKAVDTLYRSELRNEFDFRGVDITNNKKFPLSLWKILTSGADLFYFTISQSRFGNLRDLVILQLLRLCRKKCLVHLHGGYYRHMIENDMPAWQKRANQRAFSRLAGAIVLGPSLRYIFEGMLPEERIFTVANCADDEFLMDEPAFEEKMQTWNDKPVRDVLYLSNFIRSKGYPVVLELAKLEKQRCETGGERRFHFHFAGKFFEPEEEAFFHNYVRQNNLQDYITLHGTVQGDAKRELLRRCDVFALPTRYPKEGQPISILEAMGNGMAVLTTDHAGIPDQVADGVNGLVFGSGCTAQDMYRRMCCELNSNMPVENRRRVLVDFSQKNYLEAMRQVFRRIV